MLELRNSNEQKQSMCAQLGVTFLLQQIETCLLSMRISCTFSLKFSSRKNQYYEMRLYSHVIPKRMAFRVLQIEMSLSHPVVSARLTSDISEFTIVHFYMDGSAYGIKDSQAVQTFQLNTDGTGSQGLTSLNIISVPTNKFQLASVKLEFAYN